MDIEATSEDVRSAYKKLAKQWHPDKNKAEGAEEKFKQILAAYTHLQSDDRRETHAREIKRQKEAAANPKPKPPPQPPPTQQTSTPPQPQSSTSNTQTNSGTRPKSAKTRNSQPGAGTKQQKDWWESFRKKNSNTSSQKPSTPEPPPSRTGTKAKRTKSRPQMRNNMYDFMNSFMNFDNDPFDEFIFDIFMVAPDRPPPRQKTTTDPFGNKLPRNVDNNIYDWKTATKNPGAMPDYQEYLDSKLSIMESFFLQRVTEHDLSAIHQIFHQFHLLKIKTVIQSHIHISPDSISSIGENTNNNCQNLKLCKFRSFQVEKSVNLDTKIRTYI